MSTSENGGIPSIILPISENTFKNFSNARRIAMDIGGSLTKIVYCSSFECKTAKFSENDANNLYSTYESSKQVPALNFIKFETKNIELALNFIEKNLRVSKEFNEGKSIKVTGGGAFKYKNLIETKLGVNVEKEDEMQCLIKGCNFISRNVANEVFTIDYKTLEYECKVIEKSNLFPYLLVNIGSGVSILKVESDETFQRVGGSTIGGATLWALGSLLTDANGFDEILELAEKGDNRPIDMLVRDIYGANYESLGLSDDLIASSLGKATRSIFDNNCTREELLTKFKQEDIVKSILLMICYDVSQIASLYARLYNVNKVFFGGYFIHGSDITMKFLKHGICYWSQNQIECLFLRHEGYLGAIGAFLKADEETDQKKYSWYENFARSSGYTNQRSRTNSLTFDTFELNQEDIQLVPFSLISDIANYIPDLFDLTKDEDARNYWLNCFEKTINTYERQCMKSQVVEETCKKRATEFKESYLNKLKQLQSSPFTYGLLTVRSMLELREHCMSEFNFFDVYSYEKRDENRCGLDYLVERLDFINQIESAEEKWYNLFKGILAGNVYDYGAAAFIKKRENGDLNAFEMALSCVDESLKTEAGYINIVNSLISKEFKSIVIFVDNSGFDVVLGVMPFVIELLKTDVKVILCANSKPAINDVTYPELIIVVKKACNLNKTLNDAYYNSKKLILFETGSGSPCLDLSRINVELAKCIDEIKIDLIILEGMGRAIHTNFNTKFKTNCLKIAVIKNQWLANRFNLKQIDENKFPVIFKYEKN